jgi:hypothetical protein
MTNTLTISRELAERILANDPTAEHDAMLELRAILAAPSFERQDEQQMACMPVERCYDVRAQMIIAFNESRKAGGDLDDGLDAAYKAALRYSPNPLLASPPAPVAVVLPEPQDEGGGQSDADYNSACGWNACLDKVKEMNR